MNRADVLARDRMYERPINQLGRAARTLHRATGDARPSRAT
ncbi:MAG: hypothetical protein Q4P07_14305 [Ornithinimicrobium sp.]|nr:hypothetical protein [Ornithinimicrobium sp.]MDO5741307.1 hypothetical protein [Ornithinimicrobium sp.]